MLQEVLEQCGLYSGVSAPLFHWMPWDSPIIRWWGIPNCDYDLDRTKHANGEPETLHCVRRYASVTWQTGWFGLGVGLRDPAVAASKRKGGQKSYSLRAAEDRTAGRRKGGSDSDPHTTSTTSWSTKHLAAGNIYIIILSVYKYSSGSNSLMAACLFIVEKKYIPRIKNHIWFKILFTVMPTIKVWW